MRRFLCLWLPRWPTDRWRRQRAEPLAGPLALTARGQGGVRLTAIDDAAAALSLIPGMTLADARALVPGLTAAEAQPEADAMALTGLADWCGRYSPWCAVDGSDGIRLDITGCAHLFGGEAALLGDIEQRLAAFGISVRGAIAATPAAAWGWARHRPSNAEAILAAEDDDALRKLPVAALRLEEEDVQALIALGLATVGAIAALPRAPLGQRLGKAVLLRLDRLFGRMAEPISPRAPAPLWRVPMIFAEAIGRREDIDAATLHLTRCLCRDLSLKGKGARRLELSFFRVDATVQRVAIGASRPTHAPGHLARLFAERLDRVDPGFGIEAMVLEATEIEPLAPRQSIFPVPGECEAADLAALIDRLQNRLGSTRVAQLVSVASHVPERAELYRTASWAEGEVSLVGIELAPANSRPIKLLSPPEPVEVMAPVPDDPPLSFRWRGKLHRIAAADGPERIGPEWWRPGPGRARDYYRVEDSEGRRFWVYRDGLYGAAEPPRWFLHGFFA